MTAAQIIRAKVDRDRAHKRYEAAQDKLRRAVVEAVADGTTSVTRAAELAGVSRQSVHDWLRS